MKYKLPFRQPLNFEVSEKKAEFSKTLGGGLLSKGNCTFTLEYIFVLLCQPKMKKKSVTRDWKMKQKTFDCIHLH